jgi:hypothetical protein
MGRIVAIAKAGAFLALAFFLTCAGLASLQARRVLQTVQTTVVNLDQRTAIITTGVAKDTEALGATLDVVNRPCGKPGLPCGTLADVAQTLHTLRGTAGQVEIAAAHENARLSVLDQQEATIFADTHTDLSKLAQSIDSANTAIAGLPPIESNLNVELGDLHNATVNLTALTGDPDIKSAIGHINGATGDIEGMTSDTRQYLHSLLHPKWTDRVWGVMQSLGVDVAKVFLP